MSWCTPARALVVGSNALLSIQTFPASSEYVHLSKSNGSAENCAGNETRKKNSYSLLQVRSVSAPRCWLSIRPLKYRRTFTNVKGTRSYLETLNHYLIAKRREGDVGQIRGGKGVRWLLRILRHAVGRRQQRSRPPLRIES